MKGIQKRVVYPAPREDEEDFLVEMEVKIMPKYNILQGRKIGNIKGGAERQF